MSTKETIINRKINIKQIFNYPIIQIIINILFGISTACLTTVLIEPRFANNYVYILLPVASFIIAEIMTFKYAFLKKLFKNIKLPLLIGCVIIATFFIFYNCSNTTYEIWIDFIKVAVLLAIPSTGIFLLWFYQKLLQYGKKFIKSLDKTEKRYLIIAIISLVVAITTIYNITNIFYQPTVAEEKYRYKVLYEIPGTYSKDSEEFVRRYVQYLYETNQYDTIYTSDTAPLVREDAYNQISANENDIRQPLFGIFATPFTIIPKMLASLFPNVDNLYAILLAIEQGILVFIISILLSRLLKLKKVARIIFWIVYIFSYPTLLFILNLEQYIFAMFYLVVFIYMAISHINEKDKEIAYIASTGSMLTSGILFPLLGERKNIKKSIRNIVCTFFKCMAIFIISARIILVLPSGWPEQTKRISSYSQRNEYSIQERANMYTNFIKNTILFSDFQIDKEHISSHRRVEYNNTFIQVMTLSTVIKQNNTTSLNIIGLIILALALIGFILNRKDMFTKICFVWVFFSFILLFLFQWGIKENGLILYTFYFSWAFICLAYKAIYSIFKKLPKAADIFAGISTIPIVTTNIYGIYQVILFGIEYYLG